MAIVIWDCPHCKVAAMGFKIIGALPVPVAGVARNAEVVCFGAECQKCLRPICGQLLFTAHKPAASVNTYNLAVGKLTTAPDEIGVLGFRLIEVWPKPEPTRLPEHLPSEVTKAFLQAETAHALPDMEDASATMYRRSLDLGLKAAFPETKGDLYKRIEVLVADHVFPSAIGEWSHEIRLIGNDGAHDPVGATRADLDAARDFVDAVLRYSFSLPRAIELRRSKPAEGGAAP